MVSSRPVAVEVAAQAKINLRLRVLARETSGYHQIETLFLRLELADRVRVRLTPGQCTLDVAGEGDLAALGAVDQNLAWRAAEAYFAASGMRGGFAIELTKHIPIGGGLGGGSADAGAVLRALDAMADEPLGAAVMLDVAARLGADVAFLASEHAYALAWGRGDRMLALVPPPSRKTILIVPSFSVNTAEAYAWLDEYRISIGRGLGVQSLVLDYEALSDWERLAPLAENDFEPVIARRHPDIDAHLGALRSLGLLAMMSGSGSTCVGVGFQEEGVLIFQREDGLPNHEARAILTRTASRVEPPSPIE
jgi:4-diphosphocytidyl-2-C-methyl-D-erythritol kinase